MVPRLKAATRSPSPEANPNGTNNMFLRASLTFHVYRPNVFRELSNLFNKYSLSTYYVPGRPGLTIHLLPARKKEHHLKAELPHVPRIYQQYCILTGVRVGAWGEKLIRRMAQIMPGEEECWTQTIQTEKEEKKKTPQKANN